MLRYRLFQNSALLFLASLLFAILASADESPSLFRGVVVADSRLGARVVSVKEDSQAYESGLRPEDLIIQINDSTVKNIDDFAKVSRILKGTEDRADLIVLRNNSPKRIALHLYSFPILREWGLSFVYDQNLRFAEPKAATEHWLRMARGFEEADNLSLALNATLNGLHYEPKSVDIGVASFVILLRISEDRSNSNDLKGSMLALQEGLVMLGHLFEFDLDGASLQNIKDRLESSLKALQGAGKASSG